MPTLTAGRFTFDARPDRIDFRDRVYMPRLVSLPDRWPSTEFINRFFPDYSKNGLILDQGAEGACTGYGLAAVVNYLLWYLQLEGRSAHALSDRPDLFIRPEVLWDSQSLKRNDVDIVSAPMFYHLARVYDEWPGEDYEGSSCRGAIKGWYRHGVCLLRNWPKTPVKAPKSKPLAKDGWEVDAAQRPLGAYYRINKDSLNDMQAAIHEVGAIYCQATVHPGWFLGEGGHGPKPTEFDDGVGDKKSLPIISMSDLSSTGGHAFAIVGYTPDGFIVQNSWGPAWGFQGFAILRYRDWLLHGGDAWVAVLGAATRVPKDFPPPRTTSSLSLGDVVSGKACATWSSETTGITATSNVAVWTAEKAYLHSIVMGNDGRPLNRIVVRPSAAAAIHEVAFERPFQELPDVRKLLKKNAPPKLVIYAHGGLNNEDASLQRIRRLAPYFKANGLYPVFLTWRTGFWESIGGLLEDAVRSAVFGDTAPARGSFFDDVKQRLSDAKDRTLELACERILVKPVWSQMKQNAASSVLAGGGLALLVSELQALAAQIPDLEIHCVGHSAGSIVLGQLLTLFGRKNLKASSVELYAPACTVEFALTHYVNAMKPNGPLSRGRFFNRMMNNTQERDDSIGPYGKSLLYLVSRALEDVHKMPLLGMQAAWDDLPEASDIWNESKRGAVSRWQAFVGPDRQTMLRVATPQESIVSDGVNKTPIAHGSFDNDVTVITDTIRRIRESDLVTPVTDLTSF